MELDPFFSLPTVEQVLSGETSIKPLQHDSASLQRFVDQFEHVKVPPAMAEMLSNLSHHLKNPEWKMLHDGAHHTLLNAAYETDAGGNEALFKDTMTLNVFLESPHPSAQNLHLITTPALQEELKPVGNYLSRWSPFLNEWSQLDATHLKAAEETGITLAQFRAITPAATHHYTALAPVIPVTPPRPPSYTPQSSQSSSYTPYRFTPDPCGPGCGHDHHGPTHAGGSNHAHAGGHSHAGGHDGHFHPEHDVHGEFSFENALPKGKAGRIALAGLGATVVGAVLINALGKKDAGDTQNHAEKTKSNQTKANDIAYTVNHAVSCGTTDVVLQPIIAAAFGVNVGCNHPGHNHPKQKLTLKSFAHEAGHYFKGEIIGDFAAVPLTIGVQRAFPNFMHGLRKGLEPVIGWAFRLGADHNASKWAKKAGFAPDAPEVKAHANDVYEHEISHLPQAVVWNMFAYPIGAFSQKAMGHGQGYPQIFKSKLVGAMVSNGILLGGRMIAPEPAQKWDDFTADKIFLPASKIVGKAFGIDQKTMEEAAKNQKHGAETAWQGRLHGEEKSPNGPETKSASQLS